MEAIKDTSHLVALTERLSHEKGRLACADSANEKRMRAVWVAGIEKEIINERHFLGMSTEEPDEMTDDELMAALAGCF